MRERLAVRRVASVLAGIGLALEVGAIAVVVLEATRGSLPPLDTNTLEGYALAATFPIIGWLVASRRPANAIGWIFLVIGLSNGLSTFAGQYATFGLTAAAGQLPFAAELSWVGVWSWGPGFVLLLTLAVLLFPDGRLPSPRWRLVVWLVAAALLLIMVPMAIAAWPVRGLALTPSQPLPDNPATRTATAMQDVGLVLAALAALASIAGLLVRFRRSSGGERRQLKWFTFAGLVEVSLIAASPFLNYATASVPASIVFALVVPPLLPVSATLAILRYRLYEIDRIVSRTIGYSVVSAVLGSVFVVIVLLLQAVMASFTSGQPIAVAASTLIVASLFQPVRRRVQAVVDRRFDRSRYDAERTLVAFGARLRGNVDLGGLGEEVQELVARTLAPAAVGVWIRQPDTTSGRGRQARPS